MRSGIGALRHQLRGAVPYGIEVARTRSKEAVAHRPLRPANDLARARSGDAMVQWDAPTDRPLGRGKDLLFNALECARDRYMHRALTPELHFEHIGAGDVAFAALGPRSVPEDDG